MTLSEKLEKQDETWWKKIQANLKSRNARCATKGIGNVYHVKGNPYKLGNYQDFLQSYPFDPKSDCTNTSKIDYSALDKNNKFYKNVKDSKTCVALNGVWKQNAYNRETKYDQGVCWRSSDDARCAAVVDNEPSFLRGKTAKTPEEVDRKRKQCEKLDECTFRATSKDNHDCISKTSLDKGNGDVRDPPENMPANPRDQGFELFLKKWYHGDLPGMNPPSVLPLNGVGCEAIKESSNKIAKNNKKTTIAPMLKRSELEKLNPTIPADGVKLKRALGPHHFMKYYEGYLGTAHKCKKFKLDWENIPLYPNEEKIDDDKMEMDMMQGKPSIAQSVVNMVMKNIANKDSTARGLLAFHSTGSGKTCTATGVMDAFWDTPREIVFVSSLDALSSNPPFKFHECALRLYPRFMGHTIEQVATKFETRGIKYMSFAKLANRLSKSSSEYIDLDKSILIIDEVHNLFRPLPNQRAKHMQVEKELADVRRHPKLKMVILTATPGDNVLDAMKLINLVRDPVLMPKPIKPPMGGNKKDLQRFISDIRGMISYYDLSSDTSRFPTVIDQEPLKFSMTPTQFAKYLDAYNAVKKEWRDYDKLAATNQLGKWWVGARRYANMLYTFEKGITLTEFSSKLPSLLKNLEFQYQSKEKAYVYSAFYENRGSSHGILEIARQLENHGWKPLTIAEVKKGNLQPAKRYMIASQNEKHLQEFIRVYNSDANSHGEILHTMIATQNFNEGLDLKAVRHIHIFEPLVSIASDLQTLGRARRYCSHALLNKNKGEWTVKIWRYMALLGDMAALDKPGKKTRKTKSENTADGVVIDADVNVKESIDELVMRTAKEKYQQLFEITYAMKEAAIDRYVTS